MITAESHFQGVKIVVSVADSQSWTVTRSDGFPVRGGQGIGTATLLDTAAPVNEPITYLLDAGAESGQDVVTRHAVGHILTSLNGLTLIPFRWMGDSEMPLEPRVYAAPIPGRARPVLRLAPTSGESGIQIVARVAGAQNKTMRSLLLTNRPLLLFHDRSRCEIPECDIPAVQVVIPSGKISNPRTGHVAAATRDWGLDFLLIDMPGLASRVGIGVWEQLEEEAFTWVDVENLGMPWAEFEDGGWIND